MIIVSCDLVDLLKFMLESVSNYLGSLILFAIVAFITSGVIGVIIQKLCQSVSTILMINKSDSATMLNTIKKENND